MTPVLISVLVMLRGALRSRAALQLGVLALRHQLLVLQRSRPERVRLVRADRWLWACLSHRTKSSRTRKRAHRWCTGSPRWCDSPTISPGRIAQLLRARRVIVSSADEWDMSGFICAGERVGQPNRL